MDLLIVNHRDLKHPRAGGAEQVIYEVGRRLVKRGVNVTWLAEGVKGLEDRDEIEGVRILRRGNVFSLHLYSLLEARKYDVVIDSVAHAVPFFSYLVNDNAIALVHHVHQEVLKYELNPIMARVLGELEKGIRYYKRVIGVSETTKKDLMNLLKVKSVDVIKNGVDHDKYKPSGEKFSEPTILWIGRLKKYKNPLDAIEVGKRVKARLIIVGGGDLEDVVKRRISEVNGVYLGKVSEREKIELYQKSWIVIVTSFIEGWSMVTVEANACGTPVIAYNRGSLPEIIKNGVNGYIVDYKDVEKMSEIINYLISNESEIKRMWRSSYEESLKYDWDKTADEYYKYLTQNVSV